MITKTVLGLDIGGVNIKAVLLKYQHQKLLSHQIAVRPFEIWRKRERLAVLLQEMGAELGLLDYSQVALTMTAELSDAFQTKREGVLFVLGAVEQAFSKSTIYTFSLDGSFLSMAEAVYDPLSCAASNWLASAQFLAIEHPSCILIDIGSTTTDIIPILQGKITNRGFTDLQRLTSGELLYSASVRTNPNTIVDQVPINGVLCRVAAENFTCMADVYLILGKINSDAYSGPTPDGRPKTVQAAQARLARLVCADCEMMDEKAIYQLAVYLGEKHLQQITESLLMVLSGLENDLPLALVGAGEFIVKEIARRLDRTVINFKEEPCNWPITALPAFAVAYLLKKVDKKDYND